MVATLLTVQPPPGELAGLLRPEPLPDGTEPEARVVLCGLSWQRYLDLDQALGHDRPSPRCYYLDGDLEFMTTSKEHERIKKWIAGLLEMHFDTLKVEVIPRGQATLRSTLEDAGAEPDESWCLGGEKEFPELVLEIALSSGGISKLEMYRRFPVPEVWLWRRDGLEIYTLRADGSGYDRVPGSRLLPDLDVALLSRCVKIRSWREARRLFRDGDRGGT
ncbi:MAG: Uma2 family endonuclease [Verrucomicrobia bacterium]|nr:Uma2 family endonuclease [Verrucomicrobiota bacterium]